MYPTLFPLHSYCNAQTSGLKGTRPDPGRHRRWDLPQHPATGNGFCGSTINESIGIQEQEPAASNGATAEPVEVLHEK